MLDACIYITGGEKNKNHWRLYQSVARPLISLWPIRSGGLLDGFSLAPWLAPFQAKSGPIFSAPETVRQSVMSWLSTQQTYAVLDDLLLYD